ncbi:MAG: hypothetical protein DRQ46_04700 [Gammaproteobacteria bacterium]|nr:MAG: hypothetical protein DRQ46_04700 [Gammaproteobacteria bacterium]
MNFMRLKIISLAVLLACTGSGCNAIDAIAPDNTKEYRKAETMPPLDIPPDLSTAQINDDVAGSNQKSIATYSEFEEAANNPLAAKYGVVAATKPSLSGEGVNRHLIVPATLEVTWQQLLGFWDQKGFEIKRKDLRIGLMDTNVGSDDYAYRARVERGDISKQTRVYVSGAGTEVNVQKNEAMLRQIADFLGVLHQEEQEQIKQQQAGGVQQVAVVTTLINEANGQQALVVEQDFSDVWSRVGRVLDSKGFTVEDRDRSRGIYFVRYIDPKNAPKEEDGWLDTLAFWQDDVDQSPEDYYYIKLISDAENTKIVILDTEEVRTSSDTAKRLLALMQEQLSK